MKTLFIVLAVVLGIFLIAGGVLYSKYFSTGPLATLVIDSGNAQYKSSGDWLDASNGMTLKEGYSVKTLESSEAKILFSDSVMRLDANTEIAINNLNKESVSISQAIGKTWTKLLKISGISSYEISTPDAIATVRGTAFAVEIEGNDTKIAVANGTVAAKIKDKAVEKLIEANKETKIKKDDNDIQDSDLTDDGWTTKNKGLDEQYIKELKQKLMKKYNMLLNIAKKQGLSDDEINNLIDEWMQGKRSVKKAIENGEIPASISKLIPPELKRY